ncbi:neutral zinc metallopeptidase [Haloechinothrix sp. YIM 98757]|uniref:Neutral zinc metallopeptidase n=1 Tax=Haloechinothrix aidingensis TaxID=2752311 RepID=A0A838AF44_9PSEU|nr:neutral zinc metallopeptidase [Haloechinothrix aidingensis]MBA0127946.1 neutral zinc metallopeptidase [Haloechinothrix aidingensis]
MTTPRPGTAGDPDTGEPDVSTGTRGWPLGHRAALTACVVLMIAGLAVVAVTGGSEEPVPGDPRAAEPPSAAEPPPSSPGQGAAGSADTSAEPVLALGDHPLLQDEQVGLPNLECYLPEWRSTQEAAEEFFRAATACLDEAWEPVLQAHDLPFHSPELVFPTGSEFDSECGTISVGVQTAAYYCEGELFLPFDGLQTQQYGNNPGVYLALLAHEYGHHVQDLAGIMEAAWDEIYQEGRNTSAGQELHRRMELQAQCFSGMFLGSHVERGTVTRDAYDNAWSDQATRGDDTSGGRDHGSNENYATWWRTGAQDNRIAECNTFTASSESVR